MRANVQYVSANRPALSLLEGRRWPQRPPSHTAMNIRFISSLTPEDEDRLAPALLKAVGSLLDQLPIAYTLRIETSGSTVFQHAHAGDGSEDALDASPVGAPLPAALRGRSPLS
jgi:hypothetical protein